MIVVSKRDSSVRATGVPSCGLFGTYYYAVLLLLRRLGLSRQALLTWNLSVSTLLLDDCRDSILLLASSTINPAMHLIMDFEVFIFIKYY